MHATRTRTLCYSNGATIARTDRFPTAAAAEAHAAAVLERADVVDVELLTEMDGPPPGHSGLVSEHRFDGPAKAVWRAQVARAAAQAEESA